MFDMTPFTKRKNGAVLWFRTEEEYDAFAEYFRSEVTSLKRIPESFRFARVDDSKDPALRIFYRSIDRTFDWFKGYLHHYIEDGYQILTVDDIKINPDLGEIKMDNTIDLGILFAMEDENGV